MRSISGPESFDWYSLAHFGAREQARSGSERIAAAARVHRGDELDAAWVADVRVGAGDERLAGFERLAERVQHLALELRQFVEEEDAEMSQADFAWFGADAAADERCHACRMVRVAERTAAADRAVLQFAGEALDHRDFERFAGVERGQEAGQACRQHRLAGAGRTQHQQIVAAGGCDFECALCGLLALHVAQVGHRDRFVGEFGDGRAQHLHAFEMIDQRDQRRCCDDFEAAGPGGFGAGVLRADERAFEFERLDRGRQDASDRDDRAVERQLAERHVARHFRRREHAHNGEQAERDREVVVAAFFRQVGGREVDRDAFVRECEADRVERGADAFAAFGDGFVGEAHDRHAFFQPAACVRHVDLHVDFARFDADEGDGRDVRDGHLPVSRCHDRRMGRKRDRQLRLTHFATIHAARDAWRFSIAFQMSAATSTPSKRLTSQMPVGEVTLISVR